MTKRCALFLALALLAPTRASAQQNDVVDRLVAVVGDSSVVLSQVIEEIQRQKLGGVPVPEESDPGYETFFRQILDNFVDRLLVLQAAAKDSLIHVDDAKIDQLVNDRINDIAKQFGGQAQLQAALAQEGLTLAEYRDFLTNEARTEQIQQLFYQSRLRDAPPVDVTEDELRQAFETSRGQLQQRPKLLTFRQVIVAPKPTEDAVEAARQEAQSLFDRVVAGEDFADLARQYSDDPGTASLGGDLGWFRRGRMVKEFEDAAFGIFDGLVDHIVQTDYGFHIIKVERYRPGERQARHILIMPETGPGDLERAREEAADVRAQAEAGTSMTQLFDEHSDPAAPDSLTVAVDQIDQLPAAYGVLRTASTGDLVGPLEYQPSEGETRFAIIKVLQVREAGEFTFDDVRAGLADQLQQNKQIEQILDGLRERTYIDIRM